MTLPSADELELSLFGPGVGECVVVHLGDGNWMIVDSCPSEPGGDAVALAYLDRLGVDIARQVKLVVVTHWHDDHISGMAQVVQRAASAQFACSAALENREFLGLVIADEQSKLVQSTSGASEFAAILRVLQERSESKRAVGPDFWAMDGLTLYSSVAPTWVEVRSLSPSHQTVTDSKGTWAQLAPVTGDAIRKFVPTNPNRTSVALLVQTSGMHLLLGADLETGIDERRGWRGVVRSLSRPQVMSGAYKVAHHGSENADLAEIWTALLSAKPIAVLTPFSGGRKPRPSTEDVARIKARTDRLYCTAWPPAKAPLRRRGADRTINSVARARRAGRAKPGHIRVRMPLADPAGEARVETFDGARKL